MNNAALMPKRSSRNRALTPNWFLPDTKYMEFKIAAMEKTIAFPIAPWYQLGDPRLVFGLLLGLVGCGLCWREATPE